MGKKLTPIGRTSGPSVVFLCPLSALAHLCLRLSRKLGHVLSSFVCCCPPLSWVLFALLLLSLCRAWSVASSIKCYSTTPSPTVRTLYINVGTAGYAYIIQNHRRNIVYPQCQSYNFHCMPCSHYRFSLMIAAAATATSCLQNCLASMLMKLVCFLLGDQQCGSQQPRTSLSDAVGHVITKAPTSCPKSIA